MNFRAPPGARKSSLEGLYGEISLKVKVAAPPVDGKANEEVERFLSKLLGVPRSQTSIVKGALGRDKVVRLQGVGLEEAREKLATSTG